MMQSMVLQRVRYDSETEQQKQTNNLIKKWTEDQDQKTLDICSRQVAVLISKGAFTSETCLGQPHELHIYPPES